MIRKATPEDMPKIMEIINDAKRSLKERGIDQWQSGYPNEEIILQDIAGGNSYLYIEDDELLATFGLFYGVDPTYVTIYDGEWLTDNPYSVIHRVAINGHLRGKGIVGKIIAFAGEESLKNGCQEHAHRYAPGQQEHAARSAKSGIPILREYFIGKWRSAFGI